MRRYVVGLLADLLAGWLAGLRRQVRGEERGGGYPMEIIKTRAEWDRSSFASTQVSTISEKTPARLLTLFTCSSVSIFITIHWCSRGPG